MTIMGKDGKPLSRSEGEAVMKGRGAITISIYALLLAICTLLGNGNSGRVLTLTLQATDNWSFYQSKSIKQTITEGQYDDAVNAKDDKKAASLKAKIERYESDPATGEGKKELFAKGKQIEADRNAAKARGPYYSMASALLQISIVLSSTAILAVSMELLWASVVVGVFGAALLANGYFALLFL
jgi:Domain of unknown function (DUF4337)